MKQASENHSNFQFTGKHMMMIMVAFFGVIVAVNFNMARLASSTWTGLVVENSYVASQHFNDELMQARAQRETGLHSGLSYKSGVLTFTLKNQDGVSLQATDLVAEIGRPAFEQADTLIPFSKGSDGDYVLGLTLEPGVWAIKITGTTDGFQYRRDARVFVTNNGIGRLE